MRIRLEQRVAEEAMADAIQAAWRQHADRGLTGAPSAAELANWAWEALSREVEAHQEVLAVTPHIAENTGR